MVTVEKVSFGIVPEQQRGSPDSANHTTNANREETIPVIPENPSGNVYNLQKYDQRGSPDSANHAANVNREEMSPVVQEKPSEDGYNWRKYGQKNIKGNRNIRSYYRCSYQKCLVKKQVERAPDGRITDTSYFGMHEHPKPQTGLTVGLPSALPIKFQTGDKRSSVFSEERSTGAHALTASDAELKETNELAIIPIIDEGISDIASPSSAAKDYGNSDYNVASKRRKTGDDYDMPMDNKPRLRWVVETISAVDVVNDGYRWRKYGQKLVKDNPNARSYYRCTNPGCPAKKRVERSSHDPKMVITTYDGHHDHDVSQGRTSLHSNSSASNISPRQHNNSVSPKHAIQAHQIIPAISNLASMDEKDNTAEEVNLGRTSAVICKQERPEKGEPEVNQTISITAIEQGHSLNNPVEKDNAADVKPAESNAPKQERGKTLELPAKNDDPPEEVNRDKSSEPICDQEQGKTINLPAEVKQAEGSAPKQEQLKAINLLAKNDNPPAEAKETGSSEPICNQEQGKTTDPPEEANEVQISDMICKQEDGSAEKQDPPEEVDQAHSSETSSRQEPAEETAAMII